jgi:hypothetical protein
MAFLTNVVSYALSFALIATLFALVTLKVGKTRLIEYLLAVFID